MPQGSAGRIVIGGAGPAGLMAALDAARAGHEVVVLERAPVVGGMAASFEVAGQRVDFGSHRLHPSTSPTLLAELRRLLGTDLQVRTRNGRIRLEGRWIGFPLRGADLFRHLPPSFARGAAIDSLRSPWRRSEADNFAGCVRAGLGPTVFDAFYGPYAQKLWGIAPEEIDVAMAQRRVSAGSPVDIARRLIGATRPSGRLFFYPRRGYGQIAEALADAAVDAGAQIRCSTSIESFTFENSEVALTLDTGERLVADTLLSTIPLQSLADRSRPPAPQEAIAAARRLEHRGMVFVYLVCDQDRYTPFDAHYFPGLDTPIARLSEPKNYRDGDDVVGRTVLCAELACTEGDDLWSASDADLGALVADSLASQGLPRPRHVATETRRLGRVYPVYRIGFADALADLERWAASFDGLLTLGRQGLFVPDNLHHTLQMGRDAAAALDSMGRIDRRRWDAARETFRSHVVED